MKYFLRSDERPPMPYQIDYQSLPKHDAQSNCEQFKKYDHVVLVILLYHNDQIAFLVHVTTISKFFFVDSLAKLLIAIQKLYSMMDSCDGSGL